MILFEFFCEECKKNFEELVNSSKDKIKCPYCGSYNVKKMLSPFKTKSSGDAISNCAPAGGGFS